MTLLQAADTVIVKSTYARDALDALSIKCVTIPSFVDIPRQPAAPITRNNNGYVLFLSARLSGRKGANVLLDIIGMLPSRRFVITGQDNGRYTSSLPTNVTWISWTDHPLDLLKSAAVLIVPSQCPEMFPRVVVEAQAIGVPIIGSRIGGLPEAVGEGGILLEDYSDAHSWAAAIETMLSMDNATFERLSYAAQANSKRFALHNTLKLFDELLLTTMAQHADAAHAR